MVRLCFTVLALFVALPASAQQLTLDIRDGLVTLSATNVPVRLVLAEWARIGGTRVTGAERITGAPLTLHLEAVPEAKALDIVLRGAAGYMAAGRSVPSTGRSMYDRIMVLASSTPPAGTAGAGASAANRPAGNRFGVPPAVEPPDSAEVSDVPETTETPQVNPFAEAFAQGAATPFVQPGGNPFGQPGANAANPFGQPAQQLPFGGQPMPAPGQPQFQPGTFFQPLQPAQAAPGTTAPPSGVFGGVGSPTPGFVQPPAQPVPQPQPGVRPRPQG